MGSYWTPFWLRFAKPDQGKVCLQSHSCLVIRARLFLLKPHFHLLSHAGIFFLHFILPLSLSILLPLTYCIHPPQTNPVLQYKSAPATGGHLPAVRRSKRECNHWCSSEKHLNPGTKGTPLFPEIPPPAPTPAPHWLRWQWEILERCLLLLFLFCLHPGFLGDMENLRNLRKRQRMFDLEWWAWKLNGCNMQLNFNLSQSITRFCSCSKTVLVGE